MKTVLEKFPFDELLGSLKNDFERNLQEKISGRSDRFLIERVVSGGKRLRPLLLLSVFKALGGREYQKALDVAVALELAHSASLVHDDIVDLDKNRRGGRTLWYQIGMGKAVLQGHRIINFAFEIVLNIGVEMARIFVDAWERASKGILNEVLNRSVLTERLYMLTIREKTASLFEAAAHAGALLAGAGPDLTELMRRYGSEVGTVYQLADDLEELFVKKRMGRVFYVAQEMRDRFLQLLIASKTGNTRGVFRAVAPTNPGEEFLKRQMVEKLRSAIDLASDPAIPETPYKQLLQHLPIYFVRQMFGEARRHL
ncbi:MAG: polyprenyl synthetase family protein [Candidatus Caldarchaeum sp.]|nr:polyprenyl synthetase family protein [Candidatus Caldarchaeum sp.]